MIKVQREPTGFAGSRFEVYIDDELFCYTSNDEYGFRLMIAANRAELQLAHRVARRAIEQSKVMEGL